MEAPFEAWQLERAVLELEESTLPRTVIEAAVEFRDSVLMRRGGVAFKEESEIKQESEQKAENLGRSVEALAGKTYKQPAFQCYDEYIKMTSDPKSIKWICAGVLIICLASQVMPLAGGGRHNNHGAGGGTE